MLGLFVLYVALLPRRTIDSAERLMMITRRLGYSVGQVTHSSMLQNPRFFVVHSLSALQFDCVSFLLNDQ